MLYPDMENLRELDKCPKCGSMDLQKDIKTNKIKCVKCKYDGKAERVNAGSFLDNQLSNDQKELTELIMKGSQVTIEQNPFTPPGMNTKLPDGINLNDDDFRLPSQR